MPDLNFNVTDLPIWVPDPQTEVPAGSSIRRVPTEFTPPPGDSSYLLLPLNASITTVISSF